MPLKLEKRLQSFLDVGQQAILAAGELIEQRKKEGYRVVRKEVKEFVTEIDLEVQRLLVKALTENTDCAGCLGEEMRQAEIHDHNYWVIDPLDGTHNFIAGLPFYCTNLAYLDRGRPVLGLVYFSGSQELYCAQKGGGAFKNGKRISVSANPTLEKSIIAYDNQFYRDKNTLANFVKLQSAAFTTRILGVAGRDACYVAEGVLDARIWNATKLCDIASGGLIVEEAGGKVTDFSGSPLEVRSIKDVIASSGKFHGELVQLLKGQS